MEEKVRKKIGQSYVELVRGDITVQETEAVVNAANLKLAPGGGVAGAIHRAAGPDLWEECKKLKGCRTGEAKITRGYNLKTSYIIHTVGPIYSGSGSDPELLEACYLNSLKLALKKGIKSISFPALSTGFFGYPAGEAAQIALRTVVDFLKSHSQIELIRFVLWGKESFTIHNQVLGKLLGPNR